MANFHKLSDLITGYNDLIKFYKEAPYNIIKYLCYRAITLIPRVNNERVSYY